MTKSINLEQNSNISTVINLPRVITDSKREVITVAGNVGKAVLRKHTPVDTGKLKNSWQLEKGEDKVRIYNEKKYGYYLDQGTGIYGVKGRPITPKNSTVLKFKPKGSGEYVYATSVKGIKPVHIIDISTRDIIGQIKEIQTAVINKALGEK